MITETFRAMGTSIEVVAHDQDGFEGTVDLFSTLEGVFSRFLDHSELSRLNRSGDETIQISTAMARVLATAAELRDRTGGLVDPAVGGAVVGWGYDRTFEVVNSLGAPPVSVAMGNWSVEGATLRRDPGTRLDLGGIAKGWAADEAVETGRALVVSAGGDVRSGLASARVDVIDPWGAKPLSVVLGSGGLATSSVTRRRWRVGDQEAHHLIDPRSGDPAVSPILSATASCATAAEAEAAAKTVLLLGVDGLAWADEQPWIRSAMAVWDGGSVFATTGWTVAA